jgi:hypothetical protein
MESLGIRKYEFEHEFVRRIEEYEFPVTSGIDVVGWPSVYHMMFEHHASDWFGDTNTDGVSLVVLFLTEFLRFMGAPPAAMQTVGQLFSALVYMADAADAISQHRDLNAVVLSAAEACLKRVGMVIVPTPNRGEAAHSRMLVAQGDSSEGLVTAVTVVDTGGDSVSAFSHYQAASGVPFAKLYKALYVDAPDAAFDTPNDATRHVNKTLEKEGLVGRYPSDGEYKPPMQQSGGCAVMAPWYSALLCLMRIENPPEGGLSITEHDLVYRARLFVSSACARLALIECLEGSGLEHITGRSTLGAILRHAYRGATRFVFARGAPPETVASYAGRFIDRADVAALQRLHAACVPATRRRDHDPRGTIDVHISEAFRIAYPSVGLTRYSPPHQAPKGKSAGTKPDHGNKGDGPGDDDDDDDDDSSGSEDGGVLLLEDCGDVWDNSRPELLPRSDLTPKELFSAIR